MNEESTLPIGTAGGARTAVPSASASWGTFQLRARVGVGGFGEVYRAWDPSLQREVALKLLLPGQVGGDAEYEAVLREARALASVRHPNIVSVYGIDRHNGRVGFWTDFVQGKTLSVLMGEQGRFGAREAALIGLDVARALSAVHRAGLLHRDIKAENVMREEGGRILLMDFGLSTLSFRQAQTAGTPNYMAPELFDGQPATVASDIYAMGVLLYTLVAGEFPVRLTGVSPREVREAMAQRRPLIDVRPDLPDSLLRSIHTAMEVDPARRFTSAGQLAGALAESLGTQAPAEASGTAAALDQKPRRAMIGIFATCASLVALTVALFAWPGYLRGSRHAREGAAAGLSGNTYDQYQKAQNLLLRSYKLSNLAEAIKGFQAVLQAEPDSALAEARLGQAYLVQYDANDDAKLLQMAKEATNRAIKLDGELAVPHITFSQIAARQGQTQVATQEAQKARELDPRSAEAWGALGELYGAEGRDKDEMEAYQRAADLAPDDWRWPVSLGVAFFVQRDLKQSILELQRGIQLAPDNAAAYFDLGIAHTAAGDLDSAYRDLQRSIQIDPAAARAYSQFGYVLMLQGKYEDAIAMDKKCISLSPSRYAAWANLADAYTWSGRDRQEALKAYQRAIDLEEAARAASPQNTSLLSLLAEHYARVGNPERSRTMIRQALALASNDSNVDYSLGEAYELLGERAKAIPLMATALASGYGKYPFEHDPSFAGLRSAPAFALALQRAQSKKQ